MQKIHVEFLITDYVYSVLSNSGYKDSEIIDEIRYMGKDHLEGLAEDLAETYLKKDDKKDNEDNKN